jgi:starch synthase
MTIPKTAALRFAPDAYDIGRLGLMGRQVAGHGFLSAAVAARGAGPVMGYGLGAEMAQAFAAAVAAIDPAAPTRWIGAGQLAALGEVGICHRPDPVLGPEARLRLRAGVARYSLTGVTHTTAAPATLAHLTALAGEPLAPWDAVICTSQAVAATLRHQHAAHADYLRWRHGPDARVAEVNLPVIPLGVRCDDFAFQAGERAAARAALGLADDEVMALYVGRISHFSKAHPDPMFQGLQAAAERTGVKVALVQCGWPSSPQAEADIQAAAAALAPGVRSLAAEGREPDVRRRCWAAADLFVSLSDNLQETFGLTPVEAMAAGLPAVVSDWDGYRDTVRDGVDGFRVTTWAPGAGQGQALAASMELGLTDFHGRNLAAALATSVDMPMLVERLSALIADADLRRTMGEAGRARAREAFDWARIFDRYRELWGELDARRLAARDDTDLLAWIAAAPGAAPEHPDPFAAFGGYPTHLIASTTLAHALPDASLATFRQRAAGPLWTGVRALEPMAAKALERLADGPATVAELAAAAGEPPGAIISALATLAKMGLVAFEEG